MTARTDFAVLGTQRIAREQGVMLPELYWPPRRVQNGLKTCRGVVIGGAIKPPMPVLSADAEHLQDALLEPRTAEPRPTFMRLLGAIYRWL